MASLPSFVDLMASLGFEQECQSPSSSRSTSPPSLRDTTTHKQGNCRYSPYSSVLPHKRRESLSSSPTSGSESSDSRCRRRSRQSLDMDKVDSTQLITFNPADSTLDLAANAPISIYVRKRNSGGSLTSSTCSREWNCDAGILLPRIPVMPPLLPDKSWGSATVDSTSSRPRHRTGLRLSMPF